MSETREAFNARRKERRLATCRHFTGIQHPACKAGVAYDSVRGPREGLVRAIPCLGEPSASSCERYDPFTETEVEQMERDARERTANLAAALAIIRDETRGARNVAGEIACPVCAGKLAFSVASNGHVWGKCETEHCLAWMQ